ncbi:EAL domain-containing protein [Catenovulum maritimum]|uniref:Diguanylate phosphodiesterase n=1 Tax=Catenovulum maritimum TaxID=1513271 RepID=A0A0J8GSU2_9ALTE|nr:EAL domain-containing protein [Catenovulum maritimum]KMT65860.1 hypothetical protein XM47_06595 [Catenovulum maritimum]
MSLSSFDDVLLFADDDDDSLDIHVEQDPAKSWHILIVDDDAEIHSVTQLALSGLKALNKDLYFGHAYSGEESINYVKQNPDIAVILMDVVMEHENAGLDAVKYIREELGQNDVRIILRTGQPGYAPEEKVVQTYDINDYKTKTELTRSKLVTTLISAIRGYEQIRIINKSKYQLEKIIDAGSEIQRQQQPQVFGQTVLHQTNALLGIQANGIICVQSLDDDSKLCNKVLTGIGEFENLAQVNLENLDNGRIINQVSKVFNSKTHLLTGPDSAFYIKGSKSKAVIYLDESFEQTELSEQMLDIFLANIAVSLENVSLFQKIKEAAYTDKLTQLFNRTNFTRHLDKYIKDNSLGDVVALLDIVHFADINDGLGQEMGNELLKACAQRLQEKFGNSCILARVSPDVFGIIGHQLLVNPEQILDLFSYPLRVTEQRMSVNFNMGFCHRSTVEKTGLDVLKHADIALNQAKQNVQLKYAVYSDVMEQKTAWRLGMVHQLQEDFAANRLQVWFQPQLAINSHQIIGFEALLRWPKANGDMISPEVFVPLAEYSGLIVDIGTWVIEESCRQLKQLEEKGLTKVRISINVSMAQFKDPKFVLTTIDTIKRFGIDPVHIELEITESVLMNNPQTVIDALNLLKAEGIQVALDDFGTGFSSLSYLHKLPLDRMKVDRAFINDMQHKNGEVIVETVLSLGQKLGLHTIAEGVENLEQENRLVNMGCEEVQGFLYAKALPSNQLQEFVLQHKPD